MGLFDWLFGKKRPSPPSITPAPFEPVVVDPDPTPIELPPKPEPQIPAWKVAQEANRAALARHFAGEPSIEEVAPRERPALQPPSAAAQSSEENPSPPFITTSLAEANAKFARENPDRGWEVPQPVANSRRRYGRNAILGRLPQGRFCQDRHQPPGKWSRATLVFQVEGIRHYRADVEEFVMAAAYAEQEGLHYGLRVELDPQNKYDPNAIMVFGQADGKEWKIGYVDRDTAAELALDLIPEGIPIEAELFNIWVSRSEFIEIKMLILAPRGHGIKARMGRLYS